MGLKEVAGNDRGGRKGFRGGGRKGSREGREEGEGGGVRRRGGNFLTTDYAEGTDGGGGRKENEYE